MYKWFLVLVPLFIQITVQGQSSLKGTITDESGSPLPDAYVYVKGKETHAHTNTFGSFELNNINPGDTLIMSFLGFETTSRVVNEEDFKQPVSIDMEEANFQLDQVTISHALSSVNKITSIDLKINPVNSSQDILRTVPGLFIGQHAGGGKAEQIFLRGFDIVKPHTQLIAHFKIY